MSKKLDGKLFAQAVISGSNALVNAKNRIDALNVFPVPDGDTGTNMASTIQGAASKMNFEQANLSKISDEIAKNMLLGARGNSGVILSQIFRGLANGFVSISSASTQDLIFAFTAATKKAYSAVLKPIEGTILTVIRETSEMLSKEFKDRNDVELEEFFKKVVEFARISCDNTPNKLKTLREVGVTDSGGEGLYTIFNGMYQFFAGKPVEISQSSEQIDKFINDTEVYDGEFGYCTEFIIDLSSPEGFDKEEFTKSIGEIATSLVVVNDENILKVHGHTVKPGDMLNFGQNYGEFIKIKSENMTLQANNSKATAEDLKETKDEQKKSLCGIISCNLGSGIIERMREYGCDYIIESGQTQNPSAQDLIEAINAVNAETVFVLPNNSNILLVSQQAAQVVNDKNVIIIPTKTQIEGITALINFNKDNTAEDNQEIMLEAIKDVTTGEVTKAVRTTKLNGVDIKEGEYISITRGHIIASCETYLESSKKLINKMVKTNHEIISIYYGDIASESDAIELQNWIEGNFDIEVEIINGNQPNYQFIIGVE